MSIKETIKSLADAYIESKTGLSGTAKSYLFEGFVDGAMSVSMKRWTKITQENVDKVYELDDMGVPMMFAQVHDGVTTYGIHRFGLSLGTMAKRGEYYYIELPRLHKVSYSNEKQDI
jgi:hypothetical protein